MTRHSLRALARTKAHERIAPYLAGLSDAVNERQPSEAYVHEPDYHAAYVSHRVAWMQIERMREHLSEGRKLQ